MKNIVLGIDLGTTNSCISYFDGKNIKIIPSRNGKNITPSFVSINKDGEELVGDIAKRQLTVNPETTFYSIKRLIGQSNVKNYTAITKYIGYKTSFSKKHGVKIYYDNGFISPQELSSKILISLKEDAEHFFGHEVSDAVITVPAHFNNTQRQATADAGKIAGLNIIRIINEPTAAALAYGFEKSEDGNKILVYDLGGGTFDVSILDISDGVFEVLSTEGEIFLGGDNIDSDLMEDIISDFETKNHQKISSKIDIVQRIKEAVEAAKISLSSMKEAPVSIPFLCFDKGGAPLHLEYVLSSEILNKIYLKYISKTLILCDRALETAKIGKQDISKILLVGGQTKAPVFKEQLSAFINCDVFGGVNPDEAISGGAAVQGAILKGGIEADIVLLDVTPLSMGIMLENNEFGPIIDKNTTIPTRQSQHFTTSKDFEESLLISIAQGECSRFSSNSFLGDFVLQDLHPVKGGSADIEITFDIDVNGILSVYAIDSNNGSKNSIVIKNGMDLSEEELSIAVKKSLEDQLSNFNKIKMLSETDRLKDLINRISKISALIYPNSRDRIKTENKINEAVFAIETKNINMIAKMQNELKSTYKSLLDVKNFKEELILTTTPEVLDAVIFKS